LWRKWNRLCVEWMHFNVCSAIGFYSSCT